METRIAGYHLRRIEAMLRDATEILARELSAPGTTCPDWSDDEWLIAQAVAAMHGVSPLLAGRLRWRGPDAWHEFLNEQRSHTLRRHSRVVQLLADIDAAARCAGITAIALKGAALHAIGIYRPGERPMADVDLLVAPAQFDACAKLLRSVGYRQNLRTWKHLVFEPFEYGAPAQLGEHADNAVKIELHPAVRERLPYAERDITRLMFPGTSAPGLIDYDCLGALMAHLLLHAAANTCFRGLRLIHLEDIARLAGRMHAADWDVVAKASRASGDWALVPLKLVSRYYPDAIPSDVVAAIEPHCPALLRLLSRHQQLTDVSLSSPWIRAFPGSAWSRSGTELLQYMIRRVWRDRETVALRVDCIRAQGWPLDGWAGLSHARRIVRWLVSRPPRLETIWAVNAVLKR